MPSYLANILSTESLFNRHVLVYDVGRENFTQDNDKSEMQINYRRHTAVEIPINMHVGSDSKRQHSLCRNFIEHRHLNTNVHLICGVQNSDRTLGERRPFNNAFKSLFPRADANQIFELSVFTLNNVDSFHSRAGFYARLFCAMEAAAHNTPEELLDQFVPFESWPQNEEEIGVFVNNMRSVAYNEQNITIFKVRPNGPRWKPVFWKIINHLQHRSK